MPAHSIQVDQLYDVDKTPCQPSRKLVSPRGATVGTGEFVDMGTKLYQLQLQLSQREADKKDFHEQIRKYRCMIWPNGDSTKTSNYDLIRQKYDEANEKIVQMERELRREKKRSTGLLHDLRTTKKDYHNYRKDAINDSNTFKKNRGDNRLWKNKAVQCDQGDSTKNASIQCSLLVSRASLQSISKQEENGATGKKRGETPPSSASSTKSSNKPNQAAHHIHHDTKYTIGADMERSGKLASVVYDNTITHDNGSMRTEAVRSQVMLNLPDNENGLPDMESATRSSTMLQNKVKVTITPSASALFGQQESNTSHSIVVTTQQALPEPQINFTNSQTSIQFASSSRRETESFHALEDSPIKVTVTQGSNGAGVVPDRHIINFARAQESAKSASQYDDQPATFNVTQSQNSYSSSPKRDKYQRFPTKQHPIKFASTTQPQPMTLQKSGKVYEQNLYEYTRPVNHSRSNDYSVPFHVQNGKIFSNNHKPIFVHISELRLRKNDR